MVNKVAAKKISIRFEQVGKESFKDKLESLSELLRTRFPTYEKPQVQSVSINMANPHVPVVDNDGGAVELHMVSANNQHALLIGNQGFDYLVRDYIDYQTQKEMFIFVVKAVQTIMNIKYVGLISLQNINIFEFDTNGLAINIRNESPFNVLENSFTTDWTRVGAATRQDYVLKNGLLGMNVSSTIAHQGQSFAPQNEWRLWQMMGGIPVLEDKRLILTISVFHNQQEMRGKKAPGLSFIDFDLAKIGEDIDQIHEHLNNTYESITKES